MGIYVKDDCRRVHLKLISCYQGWMVFLLKYCNDVTVFRMPL